MHQLKGLRRTLIGRWVARCECGWESDSSPSRITAVEDITDHMEFMARRQGGTAT